MHLAASWDCGIYGESGSLNEIDCGEVWSASSMLL